MQIDWILSLTQLPAYLAFPSSWLGRFALFLVWLLIAFGVGWAIFRWRPYSKSWRWEDLGMILLASLASGLTTLFVGIRLTSSNALPPPGLPIQAASAALMLFSASPWMIVAGWFGIIPALIVAGISSLPLMVWATHSVFTPLEYLFYAAFFSAMIHQRYRTFF
ncbi:MAG: hypothetical protein ACK44E_01500, partial [Anaerolineales bacterium]